jgi:protein-tyrosine phosphatase
MTLFGNKISFNTAVACGVLLLALPPAATASSDAEQQRQLPLEHASNARDLGGYATVDGRKVKWGMLFRSGSLAELDPADVAVVADLGLSRVTDFRSESEREQAADRLPEQNPAIDYRVVNVNNPVLDVKALGQKVYAGQLTDAELRSLLDRSSYIDDPQLRHAWGNWLRGLAEPGALPQLFHCTAGKDRTGFAAALVLMTLGVEREQVMEDFLLSNYYLADRIESGVEKISQYSSSPLDEDLLAQVLGVSSASLEGAITAMEARYGSVEDYIESGLGVDKATQQRLRDLLLEE